MKAIVMIGLSVLLIGSIALPAAGLWVGLKFGLGILPALLLAFATFMCGFAFFSLRSHRGVLMKANPVFAWTVLALIVIPGLVFAKYASAWLYR